MRSLSPVLLKFFPLLLCLWMSAALYAWKPIFIGHRGCNMGVMNSEEAFLYGVTHYGYQGLECDARVTVDGHYVISHDETTKAVGGNLRVEQSTLAQLQAETYTQTRGGVTYTGHICTVDRYLQICETHAVIPVIELKYSTGLNSNDMSNFPGLYDLICAHHLEDKAIILTSMLNSLIYIRQNYPLLRCQYLLASLTDTAFDNCVRYGLEPSVEFPKLTHCDLQRCHNAGLNVGSYTVNWEEWYDRIAPMGVYMVTTDNLVPSEMAEQDSVEWSELCEPILDSFPVYVTEKFCYSHVAGNLPDSFPSGKSARQAAYLKGVFYANDNQSGRMLAFDTLGRTVQTALRPSSQVGICRDDAGNLILDDSPSSSPSRLLLYPSPSSQPDTILFTLPVSGQVSYLSATGDVVSADGGIVYLYPRGQAKVCMLHVRNSQLHHVSVSSGLSVAASTVGYVLPYDNDSSVFYYQLSTSGYYRYSRKDRGEFLCGAAHSTAPDRNNSVGGALFMLDGHKMLVHTSGTDYSGGWTLKDMSSANRSVFSCLPLGDYSSSRTALVANPSYGSFFTVERVDDHTVNLYEYSLGGGIGAWTISTVSPAESALEEQTGVLRAEKYLQDGILYIRRGDAHYSVLGTKNN